MASEVGGGAVASAITIARRTGASELRTSHLLLATTPDKTVADALAEVRVSVISIQDIVGVALPIDTDYEVSLPFGAEARAVLADAETLASCLEHNWVEPGHILTAIVRAPDSDGARILRQLGADLEQIPAIVARRLPGQDDGGDFYRRESSTYHRLAPHAITRLLDEVGEWRAAVRIMRRARMDDTTLDLGPDERRRVREQAMSHANAWMTLHNHHLYLAKSAAEVAEARGHSFAYSYRRASRALTTVCLTYDGERIATAFIRAAQRGIDAALEDVHGSRGEEIEK